jgi:hypothetical protein
MKPSFRNLFIKKLTLRRLAKKYQVSPQAMPFRLRSRRIEGLAWPRIVFAALGRRRLEHAELALLFDYAGVAELELYKKDRNLYEVSKSPLR